MAYYTITIKSLIDNNFDFKMTDYPIFDENYRNVLNSNILNYYYLHEIGFETAPLFRKFINSKLQLIMPYYNSLYNAQVKLLTDDNIYSNVNLTEQFLRNNKTDTNSSSTSNSNSNSFSENKNLFQDTPQGKIPNTSLEEQTWATNLSLDNNNSNSKISDNSKSSALANTNENYIKTIIGNNGSRYSSDIFQDIKNNLINIDMMIINDLSDLFMQIY
nr:MAG TPA: Lower collar protein [Caudoviricetes sp.]